MVLDKRGIFIKIGGQAPEDSDSARRCQAARRCGLQCRRWACIDSNFCPFHGGRKTNNRKYWTQHVGRFYKRHMGEALNAAVEAHLAIKPDDQLTLFEELALMRSAASQTVVMYDAALQSKVPEAVSLAASIMSDNLRAVAEVCKMAAQVHSVQKDKFSVHDLSYIIEQVIRVSYDTFKDYPELADKFAAAVRTQVSMTRAATTTLTTDALVLEMDKATLGHVEATEVSPG